MPVGAARVAHAQGRLGRPAADPRVSEDPDDPHFSLSFGGEAFFIVGLHPRVSRPARRFERPALVFNLHDQFEKLRAAGVYGKMRSTIVARDVALAGSANPMLARRGWFPKRGNIRGAPWTTSGNARFRAARSPAGLQRPRRRPQAGCCSAITDDDALSLSIRARTAQSSSASAGSRFRAWSAAIIPVLPIDPD